MEKIGIIGGTGFIGGHLAEYFSIKGYEVALFGHEFFEQRTPGDVVNSIAGCKVIINLAGESIAKRWTKRHKKQIYDSRIYATSKLVEAINSMEMDVKPKLVITASAVGFYADGAVMADEDSEGGYDFLAIVCRDWEGVWDTAVGDIRVVKSRFGLVLDAEQGAFPQMLRPFKMGISTIFGSGKQRLSWIHVDDLVRAFDFIIENGELAGPVNVTAPESPQNKIMASEISKYFRTIIKIRLPKWVLRIVMGEGEVVLTAEKSAFPKKLMDAGFEFYFPTFDSALEQLLGNRKNRS